MKKVAVVTGSSRGIGAEICKILSINDYNVILNYNNSEEAAKQIQDNFENIDIFKADVSKPEQCKKLIDYAIEKYKKIDLLVNNAGIDLYKNFIECTDEEIENVINTNLLSYIWCSREAAKYMINEKEGNIINISSILGTMGGSYETIYSVSKAGIDGLTKSLAKELGPSNIRVNSIAPGFVDTEMNSYLSKEDIQDIKNRIPLERIGTSKEIANCVLFLEKNDYITGQVIQVNGGWNLQI